MKKEKYITSYPQVMFKEHKFKHYLQDLGFLLACKLMANISPVCTNLRIFKRPQKHVRSLRVVQYNVTIVGVTIVHAFIHYVRIRGTVIPGEFNNQKLVKYFSWSFARPQTDHPAKQSLLPGDPKEPAPVG